MGKPSEASHSGRIRVLAKKVWNQAHGQQVLFLGRGQGGEREWTKTEAWNTSCFLGKKRLGNQALATLKLELECGSWTLVLLKQRPPAASSTLLANCDKGGCVFF